MASKKSKVLAIAFCAAVMAGIHVNPVFAAPYEEDVGYQSGNINGTELKDPNIEHPRGPHDDPADCGEDVEDTDLTIGDINKVVDDLVDNDKYINGKVDKVASDVKHLQDQVNNIETTADTDTHVKEGAATVADNGDVTMDIVDKNGNDTGKDVTISGLASDKELEGVKNDLLEQINNIDVEDTDTHIETGEHFADENGDVTMDIVDEDGNPTGETVTIKDVASKEKLDEVEQTADAALENAAGAQQTADAALENAAGAQQTADAALENANQALAENDVQDDILDAHGQQIGDNTAAIKNHTSVIGVEDNSQLKNEYADTNYISGANDMAEADVILDREISNVNSRVDGIENRVDGLEDRIDKVGAMSAAIANLRTMGYDPAAPTEVAVGVGQYRDETGMALGLFHYPNRDFMLSLSVSTSGDEYMGGIGATWKFGRKSPEKVAEIKKAQAEADARRAEEQKLAKAEEMKKAAKEAKVQAQMERHAKMLAEQEAQAEA